MNNQLKPIWNIHYSAKSWETPVSRQFTSHSRNPAAYSTRAHTCAIFVFVYYKSYLSTKISHIIFIDFLRIPSKKVRYSIKKYVGCNWIVATRRTIRNLNNIFTRVISVYFVQLL